MTQPDTMPASTVSTVVRGLGGAALGCGGLMLVAFALFAAAAIVMPASDEDSTAASNAFGDASPSRIAASITDFSSNLASLLHGEMSATNADGAVRYRWESSTSSNWAQFWDDGGDATIDSVLVGVALPNNDDGRVLEALAVVHVIVETASGIAVRGSEFTEWVGGAMKASIETAQHRRFGAVTVSFSAMGASDGAVLTFSIGDE